MVVGGVVVGGVVVGGVVVGGVVVVERTVMDTVWLAGVEPDSPDAVAVSTYVCGLAVVLAGTVTVAVVPDSGQGTFDAGGGLAGAGV
jgi:hypothetical protein